MSWLGSLPYFKILPFVLYIVLYFYKTEAHRRYPDENVKSVILKLLPVTSLIVMVLSCASQNKEHGQLKKHIIFGLLFSMAGDACLVWRVNMFIPGLLFFAIAQSIYMYGYGMKPFGGALPFMLLITTGGSVYVYVFDGLPDPAMKLLVLMYTSLISVMGWRTLVRTIDNFNLGNVCGLIGALLFIVSDVMIAVDKFKYPIKDSFYWIMLTYYGAQLGIALSACYNPQNIGIIETKEKTN